MPLYNLGFEAGSRRDCDADGKITLEHLSQVLFLVESRPWRLPRANLLESSNCPYFRFAVAYKP